MSTARLFYQANGNYPLASINTDDLTPKQQTELKKQQQEVEDLILLAKEEMQEITADMQALEPLLKQTETWEKEIEQFKKGTHLLLNEVQPPVLNKERPIAKPNKAEHTPIAEKQPPSCCLFSYLSRCFGQQTEEQKPLLEEDRRAKNRK